MKKGNGALSQVKKILLFTHIPTRDDVADNILLHELEQMGNMVFKHTLLGGTREMLLFLKPDIIIFPEIRCEYTRDMVRLLHKWGVRIVQRRCEMGVTDETELNDEQKRSTYSNWPYHQYIDLDLCWGPKFAQMVRDNTHIRPDKVKVVGATNFDQFFIPPPPVPKPPIPIVLFATGFGYADRNPEYSVPEAKTGDKQHGWEVEKDKEHREKFCRMIDAFSRKFPKWGIQIRPHHGETNDYYIARFKNCPSRVEIHAGEPVVHSLTRCTALIHTGSTMAYEAHLKNKPSLCFYNTNNDTFVASIAPQYNEIDGLLKAFKELDYTKSNANKDVIEALTRDYYGPMDGKANYRAAVEINKLTKKETKYPFAWPGDKPRYLTKDTFVGLQQWRCAACMNFYAVSGHRESVKCPWCGIANVKRRMMHPQPQPPGTAKVERKPNEVVS